MEGKMAKKSKTDVADDDEIIEESDVGIDDEDLEEDDYDDEEGDDF